MKNFVLVHNDNYNNWVFDESHPTQGRRFMNAKSLLVDSATGYDYEIVDTRRATKDELSLVHTSDYIDEVTSGQSGEWNGVRPDLGDLALKFAGGTLVALEQLKSGVTKTAVHFAGAKHHAQADHSSGFCVLADFAMAATMLANEGKRVAILDIDAHQGDGTENLTAGNKDILTFSIHEDGIFPFPSNVNEPEMNVFNFPLQARAGDAQLRIGVSQFLELLTAFVPDYIFIVGGADGHRTDPLSTLQYEVSGAAGAVGAVRAAYPETPILFGGAGGYQPDAATPSMWVSMVLALAGEPQGLVI